MKLIFDLLSEIAEHHPNQEALVCRDDRVSYRDYNRISDQIALYLREAGVERGDRVCLSMPKSVHYVCCILGVMKSGAAYVPMDHEYPTSRLRQIISECEAPVLICDSHLLGRLGEEALPSSLKHALVLHKDDNTHPALQSTSFAIVAKGNKAYARDSKIIASDLAYILYTSGSTGNPKGVMLTHANLVAFIDWCRAKLNLGADDRVLQTSPFTFDISGLDMFCALSAGATCVIVEDQRVINMVLATMAKEKVTFVSTVPTVIGAMVQRPRVFERYDLSSIHTFCTGSAVIPPAFLRKLAHHLPKAKLYNFYGPTESTIYCIYYEVDRDALDGESPIPLGVPFENTNAFILADDGTEAADNQPGQLVLRGPLVAAGYFKNPEKTAECFQNHPLMPHLNEKVYMTGDVGFRDDAGRFYFSGRNDDLVKSRGYRIELGEIEIALGGMSDRLEEFAALALPDDLIENRLYAAVVFKKGMKCDIKTIQEFCRTKIPAYMVPDDFIVMQKLPQTSSGKISRKAIAELIAQQSDVADPETQR